MLLVFLACWVSDADPSTDSTVEADADNGPKRDPQVMLSIYRQVPEDGRRRSAGASGRPGHRRGIRVSPVPVQIAMFIHIARLGGHSTGFWEGNSGWWEGEAVHFLPTFLPTFSSRF